jgi:phage-related protein
VPVDDLFESKLKNKLENFRKKQDVFTTVSSEWATCAWGLSDGNKLIYNVLTLILGYNGLNDASANATFLFDDIEQVSNTFSDGFDQLSNIRGKLSSYLSLAKNQLTIRSENKIIKTLYLFDILDHQIKALYPNSLKMNIYVSHLSSGVYIAKVMTLSGTGSMKLIIE